MLGNRHISCLAIVVAFTTLLGCEPVLTTTPPQGDTHALHQVGLATLVYTNSAEPNSHDNTLVTHVGFVETHLALTPENISYWLPHTDYLESAHLDLGECETEIRNLVEPTWLQRDSTLGMEFMDAGDVSIAFPDGSVRLQPEQIQSLQPGAFGVHYKTILRNRVGLTPSSPELKTVSLLSTGGFQIPALEATLQIPQAVDILHATMVLPSYEPGQPLAKATPGLALEWVPKYSELFLVEWEQSTFSTLTRTRCRIADTGEAYIPDHAFAQSPASPDIIAERILVSRIELTSFQSEGLTHGQGVIVSRIELPMDGMETR